MCVLVHVCEMGVYALHVCVQENMHMCACISEGKW